MKRNENLIPLSKEHHHGLLCVWKIREGVKRNIEFDRIRNYINFFWENHLENHFETEDASFPALEGTALNSQMEAEHENLRQLVKNLNSEGNYNLLLDFANALNDHIRFEERVVFPHYESTLTAKELTEIGEKIKKNSSPKEENYPDEFWK